MKNKMKQEISDNSDSDDDKLYIDEEYVTHDIKYNDEKDSKSKSPKKKPNDCDVVVNNLKGQQNSEDDSSDEESPQETTNSNHNKKSQSVNAIFNADELTSDDEVYMLQCPENCSKQDLCNKNIDFTKHKQSIRCNGEVYKVELVNSERKFITLAVPKRANDGTLVKLPFKGHIIIKKDVNMVSSQGEDVKVSDSHRVAFPSDLKVRHPLLGAEWKSYIELANKAIKKNSPTKRKKKRVKADSSEENMEVGNKKLKRENSESDIVVPKKKKKKHDL